MIEVGSTIDGKYLVEGLLGEGGMGSVFTARHTATGRRCALKVISSPELIGNAAVVSRFQREARAAGAIDTQHITQVLDAGVDRDSALPFLVMEHMEGRDLHALLTRTGPLAVELALRVMAQACLGLRKAHAETVVHRDIKPHNLFLAERDAGEVIVKILDFGIAKVKMEEQQKPDEAALTTEGSLLGSPLYVSPEQARGNKDIDHRTDIWSLGAVLFQMLTGKTPFGHASALGELLLMICTEEPAPVQEASPWVPPEVAAIVSRCMMKDPADRYASAGELFEAVRALLPGGWAIHESMLVGIDEAGRTNVADKLTDLPTTLPRGRAGDTEARTRVVEPAAPAAAVPAGGTSRMALGVGAVVLLGAATAWLAWPRQPGPPAPDTVRTIFVDRPAEGAQDRHRRVQVGILGPEGLQVEVDGKEVALRDSTLWLEGDIGDVIPVRVFKGTDTEAYGDVAITNTGALPAVIKLEQGVKTRFVKNTVTVVASAPPPPTGAPTLTIGIPTPIATGTCEFDGTCPPGPPPPGRPAPPPVPEGWP